MAQRNNDFGYRIGTAVASHAKKGSEPNGSGGQRGWSGRHPMHPVASHATEHRNWS